MDLFAKCAAYTTARECRERGIYPYFHALESRQDTEVIMEGKRRIMLGSNNYLGLTAAPEVMPTRIHTRMSPPITRHQIQCPALKMPSMASAPS